MAFTDYKITSADLNGKGVIGLPDAPQLSAEDMQNKFEETARDVIIPRINTVLDKMDEVIPPMVLPEAPLEPQNGDMLVYDSEVGAFVFVQKATTLANLKDVDLTGLVNGMYLRYDFPTRSWKATNSSASVPALDDINDVSITSATNGQCLIYNGGTWKNDNEKLDDLKNVYIHLPQNKQLLAYDAANDRWTNVELDGGGHKILNASGTQLTQEEYLQFGGLLKATDENGKTVVTDEAEDISFADWDALTEEQKAEYSAGKKLNILDPPDCDGEVAIENMHLAWINPNPTQAFPQTEADRTITLDTDDYDGYILLGGASGGLYDICTIGRKGDTRLALSFAGSTTNSYSENYLRTFSIDSATSISAQDGTRQKANAARTTDNTVCVPLAIYTFKNTLTAKVNVLATNVKATVDYSTSEHKIGKWIDGSDLYEKTIDCGALPASGNKTISHGISNLNCVYEIKGVAIRPNTSWYPLPFTTAGDNAIGIDVNSSSVLIRVGTTDYSNYTQSYITLRYTKTS